MEKLKTTTLAKDKTEFVSGIITNKEGNVLILKRRNDLKLDPGKYDFCSGHIKEGEIPTQSMYRELNEEIGITPEQIKLIQKVGIIGTPHEKFTETLSHIYHVEVDLTIEQINKMIKEVENPEMEKAVYLKDIKVLREKMEKQPNLLRMLYTKQMKYSLDAIEQRLNKRKENGKELCQEEK